RSHRNPYYESLPLGERTVVGENTPHQVVRDCRRRLLVKLRLEIRRRYGEACALLHAGISVTQLQVRQRALRIHGERAARCRSRLPALAVLEAYWALCQQRRITAGL